jgi:hypothetical protein
MLFLSDEPSDKSDFTFKTFNAAPVDNFNSNSKYLSKKGAKKHSLV